jgi:TonB family protein
MSDLPASGLPVRGEQSVAGATSGLASIERETSLRSSEAPTRAADAPAANAIDFRSSVVTLGELKQKIGKYAEAEELFLSAMNKAEAESGRNHPSIVPALSGLISNRILRGSVDGTEPFVERFLTIVQSVGDDPRIVLVLNDLVRLCLSESAYTLAEPLLIGLLDLKESKGEERPEVATVLASLAVVRQAVGQHESAEKLWRRVVEIRERTLPPNHIAITSALEHLASACAARGNVAEALPLLQRAHTIRALTLGAEHASLRFSRERMADLQLQAQEFADLDAGTDTGWSDHVVPKPPQKLREFVPPVPIPEESIASHSGTSREELREFVPAATIPKEKIASDSATLTPILERDVSPPPAKEAAAERSIVLAVNGSRFDPYGRVVNGPATSDLPLSPEAIIPFGDLLPRLRQQLEIADRYESMTARGKSIVTGARQELRKRYNAVLVGLGVLGLLFVAQAASSSTASMRAGLFTDVRAGRSQSQLAVTAIPAAVSARAIAAADSTPTKTSLVASATDGTVSPTDETPPDKPAEAGEAATKRSRDRAERTSKSESRERENSEVGLPRTCRSRRARRNCVPEQSILARVDSVAGAVAAKVRQVSVEPSTVPVFNAANPSRPASDNAGSYATPLPAQLIGSVPTPEYPSELTDRNGEVRVRFNVDTNGRPIMSTLKVLRSSDPLFSAAVRKVVPQMQFDPARTGGVDPRPTVDAVEIPFRFVRPKK